jgi:predicted metal-dependent HD superfamily phosphohydrolase
MREPLEVTTCHLVGLLPQPEGSPPSPLHNLFAHQWLAHYEQPYRFYHNEQHAFNVAKLAKEEFQDEPLELREAAIIAAVFHDCINGDLSEYISGDLSAEGQSAAIATEWMELANQFSLQRNESLRFTSQQVTWVKEMILATTFYSTDPISEIAARFADMDVANFIHSNPLLADSELVIKEVCAASRSKSDPEAFERVVRLGRKAWLQTILDTGHNVFKSERYHALNDDARVAIAETIRRLDV